MCPLWSHMQYHQTLAEDPLKLSCSSEWTCILIAISLSVWSVSPHVWAALLVLLLASSLSVLLFVLKTCIFCISYGVFQAFLFYHVLQEECSLLTSLLYFYRSDLIWPISGIRLEINQRVPSHGIFLSYVSCICLIHGNCCPFS